MRRIGVLVTVVALAATACGVEGDGPLDTASDRPWPPVTAHRSPGPGTQAVTESVRLATFEDCEALHTHLKREGIERVGPWGIESPYGLPFMGFARDEAQAESGAAPAASDAGAARAATDAAADFSQTNVQVAGVDEPDVVKTDGRVVLAIARGRLNALRLVDGVAQPASTLELDGWGHELLLTGDRALVFSHGEDVVTDDRTSAPWGGEARVVVRVVDVSDPAALREIRTLSFPGSYTTARLVDGVVRLVLTDASVRIGFVTPESGDETAMRRATERNRELVQTSELEAWLPSFELTEHTDAGPQTSSAPAAGCAATYHAPEFTGFGRTTVVTIDPDQAQPREGATVLGNAATVYASASSLYVAMNPWMGMLRDGGAEIMPVRMDPDTQVHRFDISGPEARYVASGVVRGTLLNQWSLDEHEGHLRVATTVQTREWRPGDEAPPTESGVTVLATDGETLVQVGGVGGLGPGERIFAVRFMGDVGYVVTFRQVDPLYVLELSDPGSPRVLGELKITGYSDYLHPIADGYLLGVGQDADEQGRTLGTQVSIFDVRDPADPKRISQLRFDDASSAVEHDHRAFLFWPRERMAVLPLQSFGRGFAEPGPAADREPPPSFVGAVGIHVSPGDELAERGRVAHTRHVRDEWEAGITRSLVVGGVLLTLSEAGIMSSDLGTMAERGWAAFATS